MSRGNIYSIQRSLWHCFTFLLTITLSLYLSGCGILDVDNPGSIVEEDLNVDIAIPAIVAGAGGDLSVAIGNTLGSVVTFSAIITDELQHVGSYPTWREVDDPNQPIDLQNITLNDLWMTAARARWVADDGARRIKEILGEDAANKSKDLAQILVYSGFAHLTLADLFGDVPLDGGPAVPQNDVYQRAVDRFTEAIQVGSAAAGAATWVNAAYGGRARAYHIMKNIGAAVADANMLPADFRFDAVFSDNSGRERNYSYWANITRNEASVSPQLRELYAQTNDSRIRCVYKGIGGDGNRVWWTQFKHVSYASPIRLVGWQELELIKAEARHQAGDLPGAIEHINKVRAAALNDTTNAPMEARPASTDANEVKDWLIHERRVEFFFEGRRMADCRHFGLTAIIKNTPPFFPVPSYERDTNPNFP